MKSRKIKSMCSMHTIDVEHNRVIHKLPTMTRMKKCKTCLKENKKHSERLWELHQEVRPCLLCNKNSGKHSVKLWDMHQTVLALGSHGEKLRPIMVGFGPRTIARVHKTNADPPYNIELIPIHMHCNSCRDVMSTKEIDVADVLDGLCLKCFCEQTDQGYTWHSVPWWAVNGGKYAGDKK